MIADLAALWIVLLYAYTGTLKIIAPSGQTRWFARRVNFASQVRLLGGVELMIAALLPLPPSHIFAVTASAVFSLAAIGWGLHLYTDGGRQPCGCAGAYSVAPGGLKTAIRGTLMFASSLVMASGSLPLWYCPTALAIAFGVSVLERVRTTDFAL